MANFSFSARDVAPSSSFEPIPAGWYDAKIVGSEVKPTKDGSGRRLNLQFEIIGGQFNNRKIFEGLNIVNANSEAQRISLENLSAICHAINVMDLTNTEQLHGKPLQIKVAIKAAAGGYEASNSIRGYEASGTKQIAGGAPQGAAGGAPTRAATAPQRAATPQRTAAQAPARTQAPQGRPAGATAPVRQAPARTVVTQQTEVAEESLDLVDYNDNGDQFNEEIAPNAAPWD